MLALHGLCARTDRARAADYLLLAAGQRQRRTERKDRNASLFHNL